MSFSDWSLSDLTDLSSDDDYDAPVSRSSNTKKSALKKTKGSTYTIANSLRPPRTTQYSAKSLYEQIMDNSIDLEADYQRDVVWPEPKQVGLIDSVFRNYYVPPVIFAVTTAEDGSETRVCIDGKQRLTSIQKFMAGLIPHRDSVTNKKYWYKREGAGAKTMLPGPLVASFANKQIVCVEYDYLSDDQEREIFQRVQLGVALTPAERMQAITGPWPSFIRELQSQVVGVDGFGDALDWGRARGRDFQGLASIVFVIEKLPTFSLPVSPALDKWLSRTIAVPKKLRNDVFETFRIFLRLAKDKKYNAAFHKPTRVSPIEFIMIAVLIYTRRQKSSLMQLSSAIEQMRADVRTKEKDVRTNARVSKALLKFITEKVNKLNLKSDGKGDKSAASAVAATRATSPAQARSKKRKRIVTSDEDSDDEDIQPPARKTPTATIKGKQPAKSQLVSAKASSSKVSPKKVSSPKATKTANGKASTTMTPARTKSSASAGPSTSTTVARVRSTNGTFSRPQLPPVNTQIPATPVPAPTGAQLGSASNSQAPTPTSTSRSPAVPFAVRPTGLSQQPGRASASSPVLSQPKTTPVTSPATLSTKPMAPYIKPEPMEGFIPRTDRMAAIRRAKAAAQEPSASSPAVSSPVTPAPSAPQPMPVPVPSAVPSISQATTQAVPPAQSAPEAGASLQSNAGHQGAVLMSDAQRPVTLAALQPMDAIASLGPSVSNAQNEIDASSIEALLRTAGYSPNNPLSTFGQAQGQTSVGDNGAPQGTLPAAVQIPTNLQSILERANSSQTLSSTNTVQVGGLPSGQNNTMSYPPTQHNSSANITPKQEYFEPGLPPRPSSGSFASGLPTAPRFQAPPTRVPSYADLHPNSASSVSSFDEARRTRWHQEPRRSREKSWERDRDQERGRSREYDPNYGRGRPYDNRGRGGRSRSPDLSRGRKPSYGYRDNDYDGRSRRESDRGRSRDGDWHGSSRGRDWDRDRDRDRRESSREREWSRTTGGFSGANK